jgi:hypothetical protein
MAAVETLRDGPESVFFFNLGQVGNCRGGIQQRPCSAGHVSACFSLFQLILSHKTLLNQSKPADFYTSRTSPKRYRVGPSDSGFFF